MGSFSVANCRRCDKVFRKLRREICPACAEIEDEQLKQIYNLLQDSAETGGITVQQLAEKADIPEEDVFNYCFREDSALGTAKRFLKIACPKCESDVTMVQAKGYFCKNCGKKFEDDLKLMSTFQFLNASSAENRLQTKEGEKTGFRSRSERWF